MKRQLLSFVWLMAFITFASEVYAPPQKTVQKSVNLNVGASQNIDLDGEYAVSITLSRSGVAEIERGKNKGELTVTGKKSGTVTAEVLCESNNMVLIDIKVTDSTEVWRILNSIKTALAGIEGLSSMVVGEKVMVMGTLTSETTLRNLETIKKRYPGYVIDTTAKTLPPRSAVVEAINQSLSENGISNIQARNYGKIVLLEGTPKSDSERDLALRIARMMYPEVEDRVRKDASAAHSINIDVIFVEVQKSSHLKYGLNGQFVSSPEKLPVGDKAIGKAVYKGSGDSKGKLSWSVNSLGFFLELLQSNSASRILSNPRLVVRSGEKASFFSGGTYYLEQPYYDERVNNNPQNKVEKIAVPVDYGIKLDLLAKMDQLGQIDASISTSVSELGAPKYLGSNPTKNTSTVTTAVTINDGQSILISGLINKKNRKTVDRVPLLADIPVLGELFKSRQIENEDVELLVLVTMNVVRGAIESQSSPQALWERASEDVEFNFLDD